jgi:hypothetical protein
MSRLRKQAGPNGSRRSGDFRKRIAFPLKFRPIKGFKKTSILEKKTGNVLRKEASKGSDREFANPSESRLPLCFFPAFFRTNLQNQEPEGFFAFPD